MSTTFPEGIIFGKVVFRAIDAQGDVSPDDSDKPFASSSTGTVVFTPVAAYSVANLPRPTTIFHKIVRATLAEDGLLTTPDSTDGVWLVTGIWNVTYTITGGSKSSHLIEVKAENDGSNPVDLSSVGPVPAPGPMASYVRGASAYETAVALGFVGTRQEWLDSQVIYPEPSHETIQLGATATLPSNRSVLTVRATEASTVDVAPAPDGTVVTVHVAEGWEHITWAAGVTVTGETDATETWVVLVRAEGVWQALVSVGEQMDTGWRDISAAIDTSKGWMAPPDSHIEIRRIGNTVHLKASVLSGGAVFSTSSTETMTTAGRLGVGWAPLESFTALSEHFPPDPAKIPILKIYKAFNGTTRLTVGHNAKGGGTVAEWAGFGGHVSWPTYDPWPETLPGVAV